MPEAKPVTEEKVVEEPVVDAEALAAQKAGFDEASQMTSQPASTAQAAAPTPAELDAKAKSDKEAADKEAAEKAAQAKAEQDAKAVELDKAGYSKSEVQAMLKQTAEQVRADVTKEFTKAYGKVGSLEQQIKGLNDKAGVAQLTEEDFADIKAEYGPELATSLMKTFGKVLAKSAPQVSTALPKAVDAAAIESLTKEFDDKIARATSATKADVTREYETKLLNITHPDWKDVTGQFDDKGKWTAWQPAFKAWLDTQPAADQKRVVEGWDSGFVSTKLNEYKAFAKGKADEAAKKLADDAKDKNKTPTRVAQAVQAKTQPATVAGTKTALQEQMEGYKEAMS